MLSLMMMLGAASAVDCPPPLQTFRYDEEYRCLEEKDRLSGLERLKHLPMTLDGRTRVSLGGEIRQRLTYVRNFEFGESFQDGAWIQAQRYLLHVDSRWEDWIQLFFQVGSHVAINLPGPPSPLEENDFDLRQVFLRLDRGVVRPWLGRRVLGLGSERLVSRREGPNLRRAFDGGGIEVHTEGLTLHGLLVREVEVEPRGVWNDFESGGPLLWGLFGTIGSESIGLDAYYLGFRDESATYLDEFGDEELRHSVGLRLFGEHAGFDFDLEGVIQFGRYRGDDIFAWTVASTSGYTFEGWPWRPRLGLSANVASGDDDPLDDRLGTFNALFPRGNYFSEAAVLGPQNFWNVHGFLSFEPLEVLGLTSDVNAFWRASETDGVFGPPGNLIRGPSGSQARFVVLAWSNALEWKINRYLDGTAIYTLHLPGRFIEQTGPDPTTHFAEFTLRFRL